MIGVEPLKLAALASVIVLISGALIYLLYGQT